MSGWMAPDVLPPGAFKVELADGQFTLPVCLDKQELRALLDALEYATRQQSTNANDLSASWAVLKSIRYIVQGCWRPSTGEGCRDYSTSSPQFIYAPADPHSSPSDVPEGYVLPPFRVAAQGLEEFAGLRAGDVYTTIAQAPFNALASGYPRVKVDVPAGTRQVEIHLLSIPAGGYALLVWDDDLLTTEVIDLNKDIISIPPETFGEPIIEKEFLDNKAHYAWITFLPRLNDEGLIITFGGGIRKVVLCGGSMACCDEEVRETRFQTEIITSNARREINQVWQAVAPEPPSYIPQTFDAGDGGDAVLCLAIKNFTESAFAAWAQAAAREAALTALAVAALTALYAPVGIAAAVLVIPSALYNTERANALENENAVKQARCCLYSGLRGKAVTHDNLKAESNNCQNSLSGDAALVMSVLQDFFAARDNYRIFAECIVEAQGASPADSSDCICCDEITLVPLLVTTICEDMGAGVWRISGGEQTDDPARPNLWVWGWKISGGCCAQHEQPAADSGYPGFSVFDHQVTNCEGVVSSSIGGFTPGAYREVYFRQEPGQAPFFVKVTV